MSQESNDILQHYGMPRRSGRYPYGSGENPYQRSDDFANRVKELRKSGMKETDIVQAMGCRSTSDLRVKYSNAINARKRDRMETCRALMQDGKTIAEISRETGWPESTIRGYLDERAQARMNQAQNTANFLKERLSEHKMLDVGAGNELALGISKEKMKQALELLKEEGYEVYGGGLAQQTNKGRQTNMQVLCPPGTEHKDIYAAFDNGEVGSVLDYKAIKDPEGNDQFVSSFVYPASMDGKRVQIRYAEEGGASKDGVIELRRGVDDISLGDSHYAQVRILVDNDKYLKGMALYTDEKMPDGVDIIFNTNKTSDVPFDKVLKQIKSDPDNPFGSLIKENGGQSYYYDKDGNRHLSLINKRAEEGDWKEWSDRLASQFLVKQSHKLMTQQLNLAAADKRAEFEEIMAMTNPTVKKERLRTFAEECDAAAIHLHAAALPRQKYQVILPVDTLKETEVYAPNYKNGETVVLIRYPHAGTFEIPVLKVNNKHPDGQRILGKNPADAIGINSKVAERMSGADFDGDTVMVIPANSPYSKVKITSTPGLPGLRGFDPSMSYPYYEGMKVMRNTQMEMGKISNLITDMTLKGANRSELERAVRHSMVVIDAEKHKYDWRRSEEENGIAALRKRYATRVDEHGNVISGASTIISLAKSRAEVPRRVGSPQINQKGKPWYDKNLPEGSIIWKEDKEPYLFTKKNKKTGEVTEEIRYRKQGVTQMEATRDAHTLSSGYLQERVYADFANKMKALANEARKAQVYSGRIKYSPTAAKSYSGEVSSLLAKLNMALLNAPKERQAQLIANHIVKMKKATYDDISDKELRKIAQQELTRARAKVGAKRTTISISDKEWEAIQSGAISESRLIPILRNADPDRIKALATPRAAKTVTPAISARISALKNSGYSNAEIAEAVGLSSTTISRHIKGEGGTGND